MAVVMACLKSNENWGIRRPQSHPEGSACGVQAANGVSHEAILKVPAGTPTAQAKALHGQ